MPSSLVETPAVPEGFEHYDASSNLHEESHVAVVSRATILYVAAGAAIFLLIVIRLFRWMRRQEELHLEAFEQQMANVDRTTKTKNHNLAQQRYLAHVKRACAPTTRVFRANATTAAESLPSATTTMKASHTDNLPLEEQGSTELLTSLSTIHGKVRPTAEAANTVPRQPGPCGQDKTENDETDDGTCAICLDPYQRGQLVTWSCGAGASSTLSSLPMLADLEQASPPRQTEGCPHSFHNNCFLQYATSVILQKKGQCLDVDDGIPCPLCRRQFVSPPPNRCRRVLVVDKGEEGHTEASLTSSEDDEDGSARTANSRLQHQHG